MAARGVIGIRTDGYREHLGCWLGASESAESWNTVMADLVERGLSGVTYAVSDEHQGLVGALRRFFPDAAHQRCQVHYARNALAKVSSPKQQEKLLASLKDIWAAPSRREAEARLARLVAKLRKPLPLLAEWLEETAAETFSVFELPTAELRRRLRSTNSIEHDHAEMRRRTRVIRIFPNEAVSCAWRPRSPSSGTSSGSIDATSPPRTSPARSDAPPDPPSTLHPRSIARPTRF